MEVRVINSWYLIDALKEVKVDQKLAYALYHYLRGEKKALIRLFTNRIHFEIFKRLWNDPMTIYVSKNYIVLQFREYNTIDFYVIGINSDKRLFINKIRDFNPFGARLLFEYEHDDEGGNENRIPILLIDDKDIFRAMGFEEDIENSDDKTIPKSMIRNYRIQGDLILRISTEDEFFENIREQVLDQIDQILNRVILQRIQAILSDFGISSEIVRRFRREVLLFRAFPRDSKAEEVNYYLENLLAILRRRLNITDIAQNVHFALGLSPFTEGSDITIHAYDERAGFGERFEPTIVAVMINWKVLDKFANEIMSQLKLEPQDNIISRGRHLIRYHGYPSRFTILAKLPGANGGSDEYIIPINLNVLHIMKGKLYLLHPEHGSITIDITQNIAAEINSIPLDDDFEERLNYIAIKLLPDSRQLSLL
jgi:hypothetical protein